MVDPAPDTADPLRQRHDQEAAQCAAICFDPLERVRRLAGAGRAADAPFAVLARNQFVPLPALPESAGALRLRGGGVALPEPDQLALDEYAATLDLGVDAAIVALRAGERHEEVKQVCRKGASWPAVGLAESETELRTLLALQFAEMRKSGIAWRGVESGVYSVPTPEGMFMVIDFYWRTG